VRLSETQVKIALHIFSDLSQYIDEGLENSVKKQVSKNRCLVTCIFSKSLPINKQKFGELSDAKETAK
jgi:hypothetical protein